MLTIFLSFVAIVVFHSSLSCGQGGTILSMMSLLTSVPVSTITAPNFESVVILGVPFNITVLNVLCCDGLKRATVGASNE